MRGARGEEEKRGNKEKNLERSETKRRKWGGGRREGGEPRNQILSSCHISTINPRENKFTRGKGEGKIERRRRMRMRKKGTVVKGILKGERKSNWSKDRRRNRRIYQTGYRRKREGRKGLERLPRI